MGRETERRRAGSLGEEKRRPVQMLVPRRPGPDRRQRNQVREVQGVDERLADVGVDMAWQAAEPGLDRVHRLADGGEAAAVADALRRADLLGGIRAALVPDGSEETTYELQSLIRLSYDVFCLVKAIANKETATHHKRLRYTHL